MDNDENYDNVAGEIDNAINDLTELRDALRADHTRATDIDFLEQIENAIHTLAHATELTED